MTFLAMEQASMTTICTALLNGTDERDLCGHFLWIALTNVLDEGHLRANALLRTATAGQLVTTQEVLTEYLNYFSGFRNRSLATLLALNILENPVVHVLAQSSDSFQSGLNLYGARPDKGYSLTDCISMVVVRRERIMEVLTNDAHFEQEGFRAVFRERR